MYRNAAALIDSLPPNLTVWQAAAMLRQPYARMRKMMQRTGYQALDGRKLRWRLNPIKYRVPWTKINWHLSNIVIAQRYGVSREIVRRMRKRLGMGFVESRGRRPNKQRKTT